MRPTRTARALLIATAVAAVWTGFGAPLAAVADPVPEACPHLTIDQGEFEFVSMPEDAPEILLTVDWDCGFVVPEGGRGGWQFDASGAGYQDFLTIVDAMFADPAWEFMGGRTGDVADPGVTMEPGIDEWPRGISDGLESASASFDERGSGTSHQVTLNWQESTANGASLSLASWSWQDETYKVTRLPPVASYLFLELTRYTVESVRPQTRSDPTTFSSPSTVSDLKTVLDAVPTPLEGIVLAATGTLLTLLVGLPGALLAGVLALRWERWFGWTRRPADAVRRVTSKPQPIWLFWIGVVVASVLAGFVDPQFGLNWMSLRLVLTFLAAFSVFNVGAWLVITRVVRRLESDNPAPKLYLRYGSLVVLLVGVLLSRLLALQPGIVLGVIAGLVYATVLVASRRAMVVLVGSGFAAAAGLAAWIVYSVLAFTLGGIDNALTVGVTEFFGGITIQGISALPIALLPFAVLDGGQLFSWNRAYWGMVYFGASLLFLLVMLTVPGGVPGVPGDFLRWLGLYLAFAVIATAIWGIDRLLERRTVKPGEAPSLPESEAAR